MPSIDTSLGGSQALCPRHTRAHDPEKSSNANNAVEQKKCLLGGILPVCFMAAAFPEQLEDTIQQPVVNSRWGTARALLAGGPVPGMINHCPQPFEVLGIPCMIHDVRANWYPSIKKENAGT
jgi:hypothetical protein